MQTVNFEENDQNSYNVLVDNQKAAELNYDQNQKAWIFDWSNNNSAVEVKYEESLQETMDDLKQEFKAGLSDNTIDSFGDYKY